MAGSAYERAIRKIYGQKSITLAIAHMSYFAGYNFVGSFSGRELVSPDDFVMRGVVDEWGMHDRRVFCEVKFWDRPPDHDAVGSCSLTHVLDDSKESMEQSKLLLHVGIFDPGYVHGYHAYETIRDAAISGAQFVHFGIETNELNAESAIHEMRELGYGSAKTIQSIRTNPRITLPNAPAWWRMYP